MSTQTLNELSQLSPCEIVLDKIERQMHEIEQINHDYNRATAFGQFPNGQEDYIAHLLNEWDHLKCRRQKVKSLMQ